MNAPLKIAFVMSRFPKLTETFVLNEMLAVERLGVHVEIYPLMRQRERVRQPGAERLAARAHYLPFIGLGVAASNMYFLLRRPRAYAEALCSAIVGNLRSPRLLGAALVLLPKIVHAARSMESSSVQHVHCHFATHPALTGLIVYRLTGIPYSFTAHGSDIHVDRQMLCEKVAHASFVVAISEFNRRVIERECAALVAERVTVLHCGVDTDVFRPVQRGDAESPTLRVLSVGTLHAVKGQKYLIEACARLLAMGVPVRCRLVGSGPDEANLRAMVSRLGLDGHVAFLGALPRDAVLNELSQSDVLVAPSVPTPDGRREGIPVVLMEAMSSGLAVVASRLSGIPELVKDGESGLLVTPGNVDELAAALGRLAADRDLRTRLGRGGRRTVEREFDLQLNATRLVGMIKERLAA